MVLIISIIFFVVISSLIKKSREVSNFNVSNIITNKQNVTTTTATNSNAVVENNNTRILAKKENYNQMYNLPEKALVEKFINDNLAKVGIDVNTKLLPKKVVNKKAFLSILFSILLFIFVCLIFFHFPIYTYLIGLIILIITFVKTRKYNLIKYLTKQLEARPNEKVTNIIMSEQATFTKDKSKVILFGGFISAIILPLIIFYKPFIIYEKTDGGYAVRYYAFGVSNFKSATIPAEHNGEKVVSLRGNTFSNMFFLEDISLPDTITEIRGQAFAYTPITYIELPKNLEYLGGGAFYNCDKLEKVILPNSLTYLGGEAFYGADALHTVVLSENLTEIRGNTFEECPLLNNVKIPDSVTRIGGHAFYGDSSLSNVVLTPNSKLQEIGSSAFRNCSRLYEITIPKNTSVNSRAFKNSPTKINCFETTSSNGSSKIS